MRKGGNKIEELEKDAEAISLELAGKLEEMAEAIDKFLINKNDE